MNDGPPRSRTAAHTKYGYVLLSCLLFAQAACSNPPTEKEDPVVVVGNNGNNGGNNGSLQCAPGLEPCAGACTDTTVDSANCDSCGTQCDPGTVCSNDVCTEVPADCRLEGECPARYFCDQATGLCEQGCASNADCPADGFCELESHVCLCTGEDNVVCGTQCVPQGPVACGADCQSCPSVANGSAVCADGACAQECNTGYLMCDGACAACPGGEGTLGVACLGGACVASECSSGFEICDGICAPCPSVGAGESLGCDGQTCVVTDCPAGTRLCDGACAPCPNDPNGSTACQGGQCILSCSGGYHSCGQFCAADGDVDNCGAGCTSCPDDINGSASCTAGSCRLDCDPDFRLCQGSCAACPTAPGILSTTCAGTNCVVQSCAAGYDPCTTGCCQDPSDGVAYDYDQGIVSLSMAVDARGYPHIAFGTADGDSIYYVFWDGSAWQQEFVTSGWHVDIELDVVDRPHIAVWKRNPDGLWYGRRDSANGWMIEEVDATPNDVGMTPDLELSGNTPHIAYYDHQAGDLRYASKATGSWDDQLAASSGDIGFTPTLVLTNGEVHIVAREENATATMHVYDDGGGFVVAPIDDTRESGNYSTMTVDKDGELHLMYVTYSSNRFNIFYVDKPAGQNWGVEGIVNYGDRPSIMVNDFKQPSMVFYEQRHLYYSKFPGYDDVLLDGADFVGEYNDAVLDPTGKIHVAYTDGPNNDVKYLSFIP